MDKIICRKINNYFKAFILLLLLSIICLPNITDAFRSACQRMHSCPSESGSYICGDLGFCALCPDNSYCKNGTALNKSAGQADSLKKDQREPTEALETGQKVTASITQKHYDMRTGHPKLLNGPPAKFINKTTLTWEEPTKSIDGTPLNDLDGYKLYYSKTDNSPGDSDGNPIDVIKNDTSIVMYNFSLGRWCFKVTAVDTSGNESKPSNGVCVDIQ